MGVNRTVDEASRRTTIDARSWLDRAAIVARSRGDRGLFVARSNAMALQHKSAPTTPAIHTHDLIKGSKIRRDDQHQTWRNRRDRGGDSAAKIEATTPQMDGPRSRAIVAIDSAPRPRQMAGNFGPNFLFKTMYSPLLCASTFDRLVKKLSEFRGRSLVHRDSPAFRLDSEGIGAGLIANSSLISSNFPLEFRKSVRKDPSKFTPIRANWSSILVAIGLVVRFDRLSRGNLSFY